MKTKKIHLEIIRVVAIFLVIFNHTDKKGFTLFSITDNQIMYWFYLALSILCKIAVPLFFMVSGALLLQKDEDYSIVIKNRVLRFFVVLISISLFYYIHLSTQNLTEISVFDFFKKVLSNRVTTSLWYLYAYIGLMISLPLLRPISKFLEKEGMFYITGFHLLFVAIIPTLSYIFKMGTSYLNPVLITNASIYYFLLGNYIENDLDIDNFSKKNERRLFKISLFSLLVACFMTHVDFRTTGNVSQKFHNMYILFPTLFIYLLIKVRLGSYSGFLTKAVYFFGKMSFGVYLLESYLRNKLLFIQHNLDIYTPTIIATLLYISTIIVIGSLITNILKKIPYIRIFI